MKPEITVNVAVYNSEDSLPICLESILNQTFINFELLIINDGSTDNSGRICDEFAAKDQRIRVIHQKNKGLSSVRNRSLEEAKGKFISFVDNDDTIAPSMLETLHRLITAHNADLSMCKYNTVNENFELIKTPVESTEIEILNSYESIKKTYEHKLAGFVIFNKMFSKKIFENIQFPVGRDFQDAAVLYKLLHSAQKIVFTHEALYNYSSHQKSTTSKLNQTVDNKRLQINSNYNELAEFIETHYPSLSDLISQEYYQSLRTILVELMDKKEVNPEILKDLQEIIKRLIPQIKRNKLLNQEQKIFAYSFSKFPYASFKIYSFRNHTFTGYRSNKTQEVLK